jgi:hypothetical protein
MKKRPPNPVATANAGDVRSFFQCRRLARLSSNVGRKNMSLADSLQSLRRANQPVPKPMRLPTSGEISLAEKEIGTSFHPDFRRFLLEASDVVFGTMEPVTLTLPGAHTDLRKVTSSARKAGVPKEWLPVCESNGDYFCLLPSGEIRFWSHDGASSESWSSLSEWIDEVWLTS